MTVVMAVSPSANVTGNHVASTTRGGSTIRPTIRNSSPRMTYSLIPEMGAWEGLKRSW